MVRDIENWTKRESVQYLQMPIIMIALQEKAAVICREQLRNRFSHLGNNQENSKLFFILC